MSRTQVLRDLVEFGAGQGLSTELSPTGMALLSSLVDRARAFLADEPHPGQRAKLVDLRFDRRNMVRLKAVLGFMLEADEVACTLSIDTVEEIEDSDGYSDAACVVELHTDLPGETYEAPMIQGDAQLVADLSVEWR